MHCFNESHVFINMYELMIMKRKENCHWKKMHPFQKKKNGSVNDTPGTYFRRFMSPLCCIVCTRYACTYSRTYTDIFSIWLICTIKKLSRSVRWVKLTFTNSPNIFWCLVLTTNKSCKETCHRQSDRISEKIIKTKNSSYSLQIIAIDSYAKCKASRVVSSIHYQSISKNAS